MTHPALDESELYDEPAAIPFPSVVEKAAGAATVAALDTQHEAPNSKPSSRPAYVAAINAALDILSYRVILLLSVLVAGALFGLATWNPDPWRLGSAAAFAVIVVVPLTFFYARR